jgi:ArsR family transcriptional regulator
LTGRYLGTQSDYRPKRCLSSIPLFPFPESKNQRGVNALDKIRYIDIYEYMKDVAIARIFKALSHPHRLAIFLRLAKCCQRHDCGLEECSSLCVGELGKGFGIGQSTVSHHLKELTRAGLIRTCRSGQNLECWVTEKTLDELSQFFLKAKRLST